VTRPAGRCDERGHIRELTPVGDDQLPFLVDTERGVWMHESDDIVAYLEEQYA